MLNTGFLGGIGEVLALLNLELVVHCLPVIGDSVGGVGTDQSLGKRSLIVQVGLVATRQFFCQFKRNA